MGNHSLSICKTASHTRNPSDQPHRESISFATKPKSSSFSHYIQTKFSRKTKPTNPETYVEDQGSLFETTINLEGSPSMKKIQMQNRETIEKFKIIINPVFKYQMGLSIGVGPHGSVCEALRMENGEQVAIKKVCCKNEYIDTIKYYLQKKLLDIDHFNLVNYIEVEELENSELNIVSELISGSSLEAVLSLFGKLKENVCKLFIEQILHGLQYLNSKGSYHGNLKPRNIFIDKNGKVKLGDFFVISRKMMVGEQKNMKSKPICYLSPEYISFQTKSSKSDIWALGCILLEMLTNEKPWRNNSRNLAFIKDALANRRVPEIPKNLSEICKNFIRKMLEINETQRVSLEELLQHPFIRVKEFEEEKSVENLKGLKKMVSFNSEAKTKKKDFNKSKTNQQLLFVKLKSVMGSSKEKDEDFIENNMKISEKNNSNINSGEGNNFNKNNSFSKTLTQTKTLGNNNNNNNKFLNRMTTAEIRKRNEEERKKFEEELLRSLE